MILYPKDVELEFTVCSVREERVERKVRITLGEGELGLDQDTVDRIYAMTDDEIVAWLNEELYDRDISWPVGYNTDPLRAAVCETAADWEETERDRVEEVILESVDRIEEETEDDD